MLLAVVGFLQPNSLFTQRTAFFPPTLVKVCSLQLLLPRIEAKTDQEEARAMAQLKGKFSLSHSFFQQQGRAPSPSGAEVCAGVHAGAACVQSTACSSPAPFKSERDEALIVLAAAFWSCLWLSFLGRDGGREIGLGGRWR